MPFDPDKYLSQSPASGFDPDAYLQVPTTATPVGVTDRLLNAAQTTDDAMRAAGNAVSFGGADRFAGFMGGEGTEVEVAKSQAARERSPYASIAGDVGGSMLIPQLGAGRLAATYGPALAKTVIGKAGPYLAGAGAYGVTGAGTGALQGAGNTYTGNVMDYLKNAAKGSMWGGLFGAAGGAAFAPRSMVTTAKTPTNVKVGEAADRGYDALRANRTIYEPGPFARRADDLGEQLYKSGHTPDNSKAAFDVLEGMRQGRRHTPASIDILRQQLKNIPATDKGSRRASAIIRDALDDYIVNPPAGGVRAGTESAAKEASKIAEFARGNYAAKMRDDTAAAIVKNAAIDAAKPNAARTATEAAQSKFGDLLKTPAKGRMSPLTGHGAAEVAAIERASTPSWMSNVGNKLTGRGAGEIVVPVALGGTGGALGQYLKETPFAGTALGASIPAAGWALRGLGRRGGNAAIQQVGPTIRQSSPLYQSQMARADMVPGPGGPGKAQTIRDAITLEVLRQNED